MIPAKPSPAPWLTTAAQKARSSSTTQDSRTVLCADSPIASPISPPPSLAIVDRVVDLLPIARNRYYHPDQHGSWSIKAVLPAVCPDLSYEALDGVKDGMAAQGAFLEAMAPETSPERKAEIESQLLEYCKLDTFAMVRLWEFFRGKATK